MIEWLAERFNPGPFFGWLCVLFLVFIPWVWIFHAVIRRRPTIRFSSLKPLKPLGASWAVRVRFIIPLLRSLAILALVLAMGRPQSGGSYQDLREGIAIQMVLDVSGSMSTDDFVVDGRRVRRLDAVKQVFHNFVLGSDSLEGRENDLIGMTTFAMFADTPCPLTLDHGSLGDLLEATEIPGWVEGRQIRAEEESDYTALGDAIALATDDLRRAGEQALAGVPGAAAAKSRIMILLTDGANNPAEIQGTTPPDPIDAAKVAATLGIKIYTIGAVGSAQPNRSRFGLFMQRQAQVDEPMLKEIARVTGGTYFRATDTQSLITVYDEIDKLETRKTGQRSFRDDIDGATYFMMAALAFLMTELLLVNTRFRTIP